MVTAAKVCLAKNALPVLEINNAQSTARFLSKVVTSFHPSLVRQTKKY